MPRNARFSEWSPNLAFWAWDDLSHYLNLTTWCKQYERYLCRIWSRHGEVSPHPYPDITSHFMIMSLYEIVPQRFRITTHLWDVTCTAEIVFQTWSIRKFRQRFGKQVFHSDSTPLVRFHVWQNDKDAIERDLPQCRVEVELPSSVCWEVFQLL